MAISSVRVASTEFVESSGEQTIQGVALTAATPEVVKLTITSAADADGGDVQVSLGNLTGTLDAYNITVAASDSAITVANKIANRAGGYLGWNAAQGTAPSDNEVTFTAQSGGARLNASYDPLTGGAAGTMTTTTEGVDGDYVLLTGQFDGALNGIFHVQSGPWNRHPDYNDPAEFIRWMSFMVEEGTYADWEFHYTTAISPITLGSTLLNFEPRNRGEVERVDGTLEENPPGVFGLPTRVGVQGTWTAPTITLDQYGLATEVAAGGAVPETRIEGLRLEWLSTNSLRVKAGSAWVPGLERTLELTADIDKTGLILTANTWYYIYLWENAGVTDVEVVTTAPATPYLSNARTKGADTTRRYLGAVRCGATANTVLRFAARRGFVVYLEPHANMAVLSGGTATSLVGVSCSAFVPPTSTRMLGRLVSTTVVHFSHLGITPTEYQGYGATDAQLELELATSQAFQYRNSAAGGSTTVYVQGYFEEVA